MPCCQVQGKPEPPVLSLQGWEARLKKEVVRYLASPVVNAGFVELLLHQHPKPRHVPQDLEAGVGITH